MSRVALTSHEHGVVLPVRARAAARQSAVQGVRAGCLRVAVTQAPEKGKANRAIVALVAEALALRKSQIELLSGATNSEKRLLIRGLSVAELAERLAPLVGA